MVVLVVLPQSQRVGKSSQGVTFRFYALPKFCMMAKMGTGTVKKRIIFGNLELLQEFEDVRTGEVTIAAASGHDLSGFRVLRDELR